MKIFNYIFSDKQADKITSVCLKLVLFLVLILVIKNLFN